MKKIKGLVVTLAVALGMSSFAQSNDSIENTTPAIEVNYGVDLMSRYIWRGQEYGQAPSIQPGLSASWQGFTLGAWGAYKLNGEGGQETDFYLSKTIGPVTIAVWDYWSFNDTAAMDFLDFKKESTTHLLEALVQISGGESIPFNFMGSYFFYGADATKSLYLELQYVNSFKNNELMAFVGYCPKGKYYSNREGIVNVGLQLKRNIEITDRWSLPVSMSLIYNPAVKSMYLVAGISL